MMVKREWYPGRGDIISLEFHPQSGSEQAGRRPALVVSHTLYNEKSSFVFVCPITRTIRNWPYEVKLPDGFQVDGVVLCDQLRSLDWRKRFAKYVCATPPEILNTVIAKMLTIVE